MYFECRNHAQILCVHIHNFYCRKKNVEFQSWKQNFSFPTMLRTFHAKSNAQFKVVCSAADNFFSMKKMEFSILEAELSPLFVILRSEFIFFLQWSLAKRKFLFLFLIFLSMWLLWEIPGFKVHLVMIFKKMQLTREKRSQSILFDVHNYISNALIAEKNTYASSTMIK